MRLRNRFALFFVTFAVAISAFEGWLSWNASRAALEEELDKNVLDVAGVAAQVRFGDEEDLDILLAMRRGDEDSDFWNYRHRLLRRLRHEGYVDRADIVRWTPGDPVATVLVSVDPPDSISIGLILDWITPHISAVERAHVDGRATTEPFAGTNGRMYKFGIVRLDSSDTDDDEPGTESAIFLAVRIPADYLEPLDRLKWTLVALSVGAALLAALVGWRLAGGIASRLEVLSRGALRIQRGAMHRPFDLEGEDEVGQLARAMDRMRTGIKRRDEQLRLMLARVAHEIRNPLGGLELFASAAQETEDPVERRRILARVRMELRGLNAIINEFLTFARPGQTEPQFHDVRQPLCEAAALAEAELKKKGGELHIDFPAKPLVAMADPLQVKRLVLNLLRNAAQAGDTVWLTGAMVNGEVRLAVRDNGPGIPRGLQDRIFEPFVGDKAQGVGLGLSIVKEMVEANHGRVQLASTGDREGESGGGAEFHVYLSGPEDLPDDGGRRPAAPEDAAT